MTLTMYQTLKLKGMERSRLQENASMLSSNYDLGGDLVHDKRQLAANISDAQFQIETESIPPAKRRNRSMLRSLDPSSLIRKSPGLNLADLVD